MQKSNALTNQERLIRELPLTAKMKFADIVDEIVQQYTTKTGVNVSISVEIQAESQDGFDESLQRTVKEKSNVLGFGSAEFED